MKHDNIPSLSQAYLGYHTSKPNPSQPRADYLT
jgi:hypothetical protein